MYTSRAIDATTQLNQSLSTYRYEFCKMESLQNSKPKNGIDADLFVEIHLELIDEKSR